MIIIYEKIGLNVDWNVARRVRFIRLGRWPAVVVAAVYTRQSPPPLRRILRVYYARELPSYFQYIYARRPQYHYNML